MRDRKVIVRVRMTVRPKVSGPRTYASPTPAWPATSWPTTPYRPATLSRAGRNTPLVVLMGLAVLCLITAGVGLVGYWAQNSNSPSNPSAPSFNVMNNQAIEPTLSIANTYTLGCAPSDWDCPSAYGTIVDPRQQDVWLYTPASNFSLDLSIGLEDADPDPYHCSGTLSLMTAGSYTLIQSFSFGASLGEPGGGYPNVQANTAYALVVYVTCPNSRYSLFTHQTSN